MTDIKLNTSEIYRLIVREAILNDFNTYDLASQKKTKLWNRRPPSERDLLKVIGRIKHMKTETEKQCPVCRETKTYAQGAFRCPECLAKWRQEHTYENFAGPSESVRQEIEKINSNIKIYEGMAPA